ncbi:MAG: T9SS type A sorting domain-containing protein [candidate division Zixibacteria bacterium]|nr:T9SS type A sorting domain-containing protein [candidate division Zixibacteria bacterium]
MRTILVAILLLLIFTILVFGETYHNKWVIIESPVEVASSGSFKNYAVINQSVADEVTDGKYINKSAFLFPIEPVIRPGLEIDLIPDEIELSQNYPNPFNALSSIKYGLPEDSKVCIEVYNLLGQKVEILFDGRQDAGYHSIQWDASNYSSGIYFYKLTTENKTLTKRMTLLK